ncbi:MAG: tail fiber domain-containing protein [Patescibacteria group bacterium]
MQLVLRTTFFVFLSLIFISKPLVVDAGVAINAPKNVEGGASSFVSQTNQKISEVKVFFTPLYVQTVGDLKSIFNGAYGVSNTALNSVISLGKGVQNVAGYQLVHTGENIGSGVASAHVALASVGSIWDSMIGNISDYFVPFFTKDSTKIQTTPTQIALPKNSSNNTSNTVVTHTNTIIEKMVQVPSYVPIENSDSLSKLRYEMVSLNTNSVDYLKGLISQQGYRNSESIYKTVTRAGSDADILSLSGLTSFGSSNATTTAAGNFSIVGNLNFNGAFYQNGSPFVGSQWTTSGSNISYSAGNVGVGTTNPSAKLNVENSSYTNNQVVFSNGVTGTPPTLAGQSPSFVIQSSETGGSAPFMFGYNNNGNWDGFITANASGNFGQMALVLGSGSTGYSALENVGSSLYVGGTADNNARFGNVIFNNSGNVGIGTTAPGELFNIVGTNPKPVIGKNAHTPLYSVYDSQNNTTLEINTNTANGFAGLVLSNTDTTSGSTLGSFSFASAGTSASEKRGAVIGSSLESSAASAVNANLVFYTNNAGSLGERMRISAAGTVTATGAITSGGSIQAKGNSYSSFTGAGVELTYTGDTGGIVSYDRTNSLYKNLAFDALTTQFWTSGSERMRIDTNGNVGIGTTTPGEKLSVVGNGLFSGNVSAASVVTDTITGAVGYGDSITLGGHPKLHDSGGPVFGFDNTGNVYTTSNNTYLNNIFANGNVGIGTTNPGYKLDIVNSVGSDVPSVLITNNGNANWLQGNRVLTPNLSTGLHTISMSSGVAWSAKNAVYLGFYYAGAGSNSNRLILGLHSVDDNWNFFGSGGTAFGSVTDPGAGNFTIQGNVGIGTTSPSSKLSVAGDIDITSALKLNGTSMISGATQAYSFGTNTVVNSNPTGEYAMAFGQGNSVTSAGNTAMAFGTSNAVTGAYSHAFGYGQNGIGSYGTKIGWGGTNLLFDGGNNVITFSNSPVAMSNSLTVAGNVGIGLISPVTQLQVAASTTNSSIKTGSLELQSYSTNNAWMFDNLYFNGGGYSYRNNGYGVANYFLNGGSYLYTAGSGTAGASASPSIRFGVTNAGTVGLGGSLTSTTDFTGAALVALSTGNVGIGTTNPLAKLDVRGDTLLFGNLGLTNGVDSSLNIAAVGSGQYRIATDVSGRWLTLASDNSVDTLTVRGGNIGIGTTTPSEKLTVVGNGIFSGNLSATNLAATGNITLPYNLAGSTGIVYMGSDRFLYAGGGDSTNPNLFLGKNAGNSTNSTIRNIGIGTNSLGVLTSGSDNVAVGMSALSANSSGGGNVALGYNAMRDNVTGLSNIAIGYNSLLTNASGGSNVAIGVNTMQNSSGGSTNIGIGQYSLYANSGDNNLAVGPNTLFGNTTGHTNAAFGYEAGRSNTTGANNLFLGYNAGYTDGSVATLGNLTNATAIGYNAQVTASNSLILGGTGASAVNVGIGTTNPGAKLSVVASANYRNLGTSILQTGSALFAPGNFIEDYTGGSGTGGLSGFSYYQGQTSWFARNTTGNVASTDEVWRIDPNQNFIFNPAGNSGNVGIGTTTPSAQLTTTGTVQFAHFGAGSLQTDANGNVTVSSDERLKDIQGNFSTGLSAIEQLTPISYKWKASTGYDTNNTYTGFSAQNVKLAIPEAVSTDKNGYLTLSDRPILATVVNALKEIASLSGEFKNKLIAWFADAGNGIGDFFVNRSHQKTLCVGDSGSETCITKTQLDAILLKSNQAVTTYGTSTSGTTSTTTPDTGTSGTSTDTTSTTTPPQTTDTGTTTPEVTPTETIPPPTETPTPEETPTPSVDQTPPPASDTTTP